MTPTMPDIAFINNTFMPLSQAKVSVEDRGFQFGDGVYELLRVYGGVPFHVEDHIARLVRSAHALRLPMPFDAAHWTGLIVDAVKQSGYREGKVYIQLTRGVSARDHTFSTTLQPTVVMTVREFTPPPTEWYSLGVDVLTVPDIRWGRCDIKSICLLANVLAKQQAREVGAFEALFTRDGLVLEGATSNVMAIRDGTVHTPPEGPWLLSGVTRMVTLDLARAGGLPVKEATLAEPEMYSADELLLTGTTIEILPVTRVNNRPIGDGKPGPLTAELMARFRRHHA
jgi:D-alanine transaminase